MSNYQKKFWKRGESGMTPILAGDLNKYEDYLFMHDQKIENLTHIPEGSTTADLEVIDGRVGYDGEIFNSLGDAIRGQIEDVYDRMGHPIYPKGTISFENLPNFDVVTVGDMYNISNDFTTDNRFVEGSGKKISAGANVYAIDVSGTMKWDLFAPVNNIVIDNDLSDTSKNPVQNKVVTGNLKDLKARTHTNLLNPTAQTQTVNGVTFTNNGDGTYTVNGTATAMAYIRINNLSPIREAGKYKLIGCPNGGASNTFQEVMYIGSTTTAYNQNADGIVVNIPANYVPNVQLYVYTGNTFDNLIFKPMLTTDLNATYDDFIPYSGSGALNENVAEMYNISRNNIVKFKEYQVTFDGAEALINMANDNILATRVLSVTHIHSSGLGYAIQFIPSTNPYQMIVARQRWNSGTPMGITTSEIVTLRVNYY